MKKTISIILLSIMVSCSLVACSGKPLSSEFSLGMVSTNEYKDKSQIILYDDSMKEVDHQNISVANVEITQGKAVNGKYYMMENGNSDSREYGKVLSLDGNTGEIEEYEFNRINMTAYQVSEDYIYVCSNLNWVFAVDQMNLQTHEMKTAETSDYLIYDFCQKDQDVYMVIEKTDQKGRYLYKYSFVDDQWTELAMIMEGDSEGFMDIVARDNDIDVLLDDHFYQYDYEGKLLQDIQVSNSEDAPAAYLYQEDQDLYAVITDLNNGSDESLIQKYNENGAFEQIASYPGTIIHMEKKDDKYYINDFNTIFILHNENGVLVSEQQIETAEAYDYCGGYFIK